MLTNRQPEDQRKIRGYAIIAKGDTPKIVDKETFSVPSQNSNRKYKVILKKRWLCECPDFVHRKQKCKHIHAVEFLLKMRVKVDDSTIPFADEDKTKCEYCKSVNVKKNGNRKTANGVKQRFQCLDCKKTFIKDSVFARLSVDSKIATLAMDLYYKGLSLREIADTLKQFYGVTVSHETVRQWITKFTEKINDYTKNLKPRLSEAWHLDEQAIKSEGKEKWIWNMIDEKTRFLIANNVTDGRTIEEASQVLRLAKETAGTVPKFVVTDGLMSYGQAMKDEYHAHGRRPDRVQHIRLESIRKKPDNNVIERYHGTFRERDKVMRGFKGGEKVFSTGFKNYYNFVRPHMGIGMTPASMAGIDLQLGQNRWMGLLKRTEK